MRILSFLILLGIVTSVSTRSGHPHGEGFKISCSKCHSSKGWQFDREIYSFDHNTTKLPLAGQHKIVNCRKCHISLVFSEAKTECIDCHNDVHQATTGSDCSRCHTPESWLVNNITEIHQMSRFPLLGAHRTADCADCHKSESLVRFDVPGINCIDCHRQDYLATTSPNHTESGFSQDCSICHPVNSFQWTGTGFNHNFFPLVQGHAARQCTDCHTTGLYSDASPDCNSCHQADYLATTNPNHSLSKFPVNCSQCHTLAPGWKPATFDHSFFPLTQGHSTPQCIDCHKDGNYTTTPRDCYSCHQADYNATTDPNHSASNFPVTCNTCHSLAPGWKPATFNHSFFPLTLGHSTPKCADCHVGGNYTNTPADCYSCHQTDYNNAANPNHKTLSFSTTCTQCHTTNPGWTPASYKQHDSQYFPVYSGRHKGTWNTCTECHPNAANYAEFTCLSCHAHNKTDMDRAHSGRNGYSYNSVACLNCHPTGNADK